MGLIDDLSNGADGFWRTMPPSRVSAQMMALEQLAKSMGPRRNRRSLVARVRLLMRWVESRRKTRVVPQPTGAMPGTD
jgi:hypothetical protein